jgi:hypothetical protein
LYFWRKTNAAGTAYTTYTMAGLWNTWNGGITPNGTIQVGQGFAKTTQIQLHLIIHYVPTIQIKYKELLKQKK